MGNCTRLVFQHLFERDLRLLSGPVCETCDAKVRHPLLPWLVGGKFAESIERILFVGKPHLGEPGEILPSGIIDPTQAVPNLWRTGSAYWSYTRKIAETLYGRDAFDFIAFTNLVKCTNTPDDCGGKWVDQTTSRMAESCVARLGVIWREIELLEARTVVFYTHNLFPGVLTTIPVALNGAVHEIHPLGYFKLCRNKRLRWWERVCGTKWTDNLRVLVTGHPLFMAKSEYVGLLADWLRPTQASKQTAKPPVG